MINESYTAIVCENDIQVNDIRLTFKKQSNSNVLKIPKIITIDNWLASEYQDYLIIEKIEELYVLNGIEEKIIWEDIINSDLKKRQESKVSDITNIAQQAINANRIISTYHIDAKELQKNMAYKEPKYFLEWRNEFQKECLKKGLTTKYDFINKFTEFQQEKVIIKNEKILLISLDDSKCSYKRLIKELSKNNEISDDLANKKNKCVPTQNAYQNYDHEISAVIEWIKEKKSKKQHRLLIMSPALEKIQVKLQNAVDRNIQPSIFKDIQLRSIINTSLKRPLSAEPIIQAALILIKINENKLISIKELNELFLFDNWLSKNIFIEKQYFASMIKASKKKFISLTDLQNLLKKTFADSRKEDINKLINAFNISEMNRDKWPKYNNATVWGELILSYLDQIKFGKINQLIHFENNNLKHFFKVLNQLNFSHVIPKKLRLEDYSRYLEYYLENFVPNQPNEESSIDIYGFYENPSSEYDGIWLMNMNDNFWPSNDEYNPFLSKKIQEKYNLFNYIHHKKLYLNKINRLTKLSPSLSISFSLKDNDTLLSASPWNKTNINKHPLIEKKTKSLLKVNQHFIDDHQATPLTTNDELIIKSGRDTIENQNKCPAWAFYANRLGCSQYSTDEQDEISKGSEGSLVHRALELFWRRCKSSETLLSMDESELHNHIKDCVKQALREFLSTHNEMDGRLLSMQNKYLQTILHRWLSEEKLRPSFTIDMLEKSYEIKIKNIKFKIRIDRVDRIDGNNKLLIDYKTGKNVISRKALFSNDLTDLQLPIYACFSSIIGLSGVAIGHINRGKINLYGVLSSDSNTISKQLSSKIDNSVIKDWHSLTNLWRNKIEKIVEQYLSGNAAVTFDENIDFTYCDVLPLLRLAEKKYQFEFYG